MAELRDILLSGDIEALKLAPSVQPWEEGKLSYDSVKKTLAFQNDVSDVLVNIGQETFMRVVNNSGATITNGMAVRHNGVSGGLPQIELALADSFTNATVLGITTHDIPNGNEGLITIEGVISDFDTSLLSVGVPLYLSDTIPGTFESVPPAVAPDIATQVGGCLVSGVNGSIQVSIHNTINLPNVLAAIKGYSGLPFSLTATPQNIVNYDIGGSVILPFDLVAGTITVKDPGFYRFIFSWSGTSTVDQKTITWEIYDVTNAQVVYTHYQVVARDQTSDQTSGLLTVPLSVADPDTVFVMRASANQNMDILPEYMDFDINSIHIR